MIEFNWGKYFTEEEFKCRYTGNCNMDQYFIDQLNKLRDIYAKPITISSGYRDPTHPIEAKKKSPGAHASGMACDIYSYSIRIKFYWYWCKSKRGW